MHSTPPRFLALIAAVCVGQTLVSAEDEMRARFAELAGAETSRNANAPISAADLLHTREGAASATANEHAGASPRDSQSIGNRYAEIAGVVSAEAEHATRRINWRAVPGKSGIAMRDAGKRGVDGMFYEIQFQQRGKFYVFLLCRHDSANGAEADDAFVTLDGEKLWASDGKTRPEGMQARHNSFSWSSSPKAGHTPANIKPGPVHFVVSEPGWKTLAIRSRSAGFEIDKIVLQYEDSTPPQGGGPAETTLALPEPTEALK